MKKRRQSSGEFFRRLKMYSEPAKKPSSLIRKYKDSDAWLWTEVAAVVIGLAFVIPTAVALWIDLEDRKTQRIAQAWELVTRTAPGNAGKGPALEYLNSQGIALVGIDLSVDSNGGQSYLAGVDLSGADLEQANLSETNLRYANLSETNLRYADLSGADLRRANLSGADLEQADLSRADLQYANLSGADLEQADLSRADLQYADLSGTDLEQADLSRADLWSADLSGANLRRANLLGANLQFADLSRADLWSADLSGANLRRANLSETSLRGVNLSGANLSGVQNLVQDSLDDACGEKTVLPSDLIIKLCPYEDQ